MRLGRCAAGLPENDSPQETEQEKCEIIHAGVLASGGTALLVALAKLEDAQRKLDGQSRGGRLDAGERFIALLCRTNVATFFQQTNFLFCVLLSLSCEGSQDHVAHQAVCCGVG